MSKTKDFAAMVANARSAFATGKTRDVDFRIQQLKNLHRMLTENEAEMVHALHKDLRKPKTESIIMEINVVKSEVEIMIENCKKWSKPERVQKTLVTMMDTPVIIQDPYGVVLVIGAWNYPIQVSLDPVAGAIAAGNCVIIKPSELAPATAQLMADLIPRYLDPECFQVVTGGPAEVQELMKQKFDYIIFTGSIGIGKLISEAANKHLTPVTLELGGKSPVYVDESADLSMTARRILWGKLINLGQTCVAPDYILCTKETEEKLVKLFREVILERFGKDPQKSLDLGRIINKRHIDRLNGLLNSGKAVIGGKSDPDDLWIEPTVLVNVKPTDPVMQEEIFGPILPILEVKSVHEAIRFINDREKPLSLYIFSKNAKVSELVINNTSSGSVCVNDVIVQASVEELPFGGVGCSGMGAYHGKYSFDIFTHKKSCLIRSFSKLGEAMGKDRYPPYSDARIDRLLLLLKKRELPSLNFVLYLATFVLGAASSKLLADYGFQLFGN